MSKSKRQDPRVDVELQNGRRIHLPGTLADIPESGVVVRRDIWDREHRFDAAQIVYARPWPPARPSEAA
jgi:hypothetical protein